MSRHPHFKQTEASRPDFESDTKMTFVKTPNPDWKPGSGSNAIAPPGRGAFVEIDPTSRKVPEVYRMLISAVTPRPIAFISTVNTDGAINLAPFSYFNLASANPPTVMISLSHSHPPKRKETCQNILDTKEFCVNMIAENFIEASNFTSIDSPPGISEWSLAGLTPTPNKVIKAPRVGESPFSMECELVHHYDIISDDGTLSSTVMLGRVRLFHVDESIINLDNLLVDTAKLAPVARLGGIQYGSMKHRYELERPVWKDWKDREEIQNLVERREVSKI